MKVIISLEKIESKIFTIRNQKVMFDRDLAELYEVETRILVQAEKEILADSQMISCSNSRKMNLIVWDHNL